MTHKHTSHQEQCPECGYCPTCKRKKKSEDPYDNISGIRPR